MATGWRLVLNKAITSEKLRDGGVFVTSLEKTGCGMYLSSVPREDAGMALLLMGNDRTKFRFLPFCGAYSSRSRMFPAHQHSQWKSSVRNSPGMLLLTILFTNLCDSLVRWPLNHERTCSSWKASVRMDHHLY